MDAEARGPRSNATLALVLACALLALLGFVALGLWQVQRLGWKEELIARVDRQLRAEPQAAPPANATLIREVCNIGCRDGSRDRRRRRGTRLSAGRSIAEVRAKKNADRASYGFLSEVDVSLLNGAFEVCIAQRPVDVRVVIADTRIEGSITGGRNC